MEQDDPKRSAVLKAALGLFGRYGFQKTSMGEIAEAAHISRPGLYLLFPNKEQLNRATMHGVMERSRQAMEACFSDETLGFEDRGAAALDALMSQYVGTLRWSETWASCWRTAGPTRLDVPGVPGEGTGDHQRVDRPARAARRAHRGAGSGRRPGRPLRLVCRTAG